MSLSEYSRLLEELHNITNQLDRDYELLANQRDSNIGVTA